MRDPNGISSAELAERRERVLRTSPQHDLTGYVVFDQHYIRYLTNFSFLATERPVALAGNASGDLMVFVPEFEVERVRAETDFDRVEAYPEYPGHEHPMRILARVLLDMGIAGAVGADQDGYPGILGYEGPSLSDAIGGTVSPLAAAARGDARSQERGRGRADPRERPLVQPRSSAAAAVQRSRRDRGRGRACARATSRRSPCTRRSARRTAEGSPRRTASRPATAARSASGARGRTRSRTTSSSQPGDVLVSETSAPIWGYNAELERAMIIGEPTAEMRRLFDHMLGARGAALGALRPGVTCADVDEAVLAYFEANAILPYWRQHTGHAIGLRNHEAPFLDVGDSHADRAGHGVHRRAGRLRRRSSEASATPTRRSSRPTASSSSPRTRPSSNELTIRRAASARQACGPSDLTAGRNRSSTTVPSAALLDPVRLLRPHHVGHAAGSAADRRPSRSPRSRAARPRRRSASSPCACRGCCRRPATPRRSSSSIACATLSRCSCHSLAFGRSQGDGRPKATP